MKEDEIINMAIGVLWMSSLWLESATGQDCGVAILQVCGFEKYKFPWCERVCELSENY